LYFFLNEELHHQIRTHRGKDLLVAWNYPKRQKVTLNYTDVKRRKKKAFTTKEVTQLIGRNRISVQRTIDRGHIAPPQYSYSLETGRKKEYWWSEADIMGLLDYFANLSIGRPRKDGQLIHTYEDLPTPRELRALINDEDVMYVRRGEDFVPTWRAQDF
jgi:hypothetical protein